MTSFQENTQEPEQVPGVNKTQVFEDIKAVLEQHYLSYLMQPDNDEAYTAYKIMQDVRKHLELSVEETEA